MIDLPSIVVRPALTADEIDQLVTLELRKGTPRSEPYRRGMRDAMRRRILGATMPQPFKEGTVEFDAYYAGVDRGHATYRVWGMEEKG